MFNNLVPTEAFVMENWIKTRIKEIANIYSKQPGYIQKVEVPYIMRYFLQFPSQSEVSYTIIPEIEKLEVNDHKDKEYVEVEAFEKYFINNILRNNIYPAQDHSLLLEAYRLIDTDKKGYVDLHTLENILKNFKDTYNKTQIKEFEEFIMDNENDFLEKINYKDDDNNGEKVKIFKAKKFYYENYIRKVLFDNKKHLDSLLEDYLIYYNQYLVSKGIK